MTIEFQAWPKIPRLFKGMVVTEKIDGTNGAVIIEHVESDLNIALENIPTNAKAVVFAGTAPDFEDSSVYYVAAQSRNKLITPGKSTDNAGFAGWVWENAESLVKLLGAGRHYGEWWGSGIQRGYGLPKGEKRFSLFLANKYPHLWDPDHTAEAAFNDDGYELLPELGVVPLLAEGPFDLDDVHVILDGLKKYGSHAQPGFMNPEGVVVFHEASRQVYKAFIDDDGQPKGKLASYEEVPLDLAFDIEHPFTQYDIPADHLDALAREPKPFA